MVKQAPVRQIGIQTRSMTGTRPDGNRYESALERDFMILVEDHPEFKSYAHQPIWIAYRNPVTGKMSRYPPDGLVRWTTDRPPLLLEIKYREAWQGKWREFRAKFRAAKLFAAEQGWDFAIFTEADIRSDRIFNIRFLKSYKKRTLDPALARTILATIGKRKITINQLTADLEAKKYDAPSVVTCAWTLVANRQIAIDWETMVTANTLLWLEP